MVLYPEVQRKAQQELDAVVGNDRLPTFEDRDRLPYICALVSEVYRWMPVVPLSKLFCLRIAFVERPPNIHCSHTRNDRRYDVQRVPHTERFHGPGEYLVGF